MKLIFSCGLAATLTLLTGCVSSPTVRVANSGIGGVPEFETGTNAHVERQPAFTDLNAEVFFYNNDFGRNEFLRSAPGSR